MPARQSTITEGVIANREGSRIADRIVRMAAIVIRHRK